MCVILHAITIVKCTVAIYIVSSYTILTIQGGIQVNILDRNGSLAHQLTGGSWVGASDST